MTFRILLLATVEVGLIFRVILLAVPTGLFGILGATLRAGEGLPEVFPLPGLDQWGHASGVREMFRDPSRTPGAA